MSQKTVKSNQAELIPFPAWMLEHLDGDRFHKTIDLVKDEQRRHEFSKAAVLGTTTLGMSIGIIGHILVTNACGDSEMGELAQEWYNQLDDDTKRHVRCTVLSAYQIEPGQVAAVAHRLAAGAIGHGAVRPVVEETVRDFLPWDSMFESGIAEFTGLGFVQGYLMINDIRRYRNGELTKNERNVSLARRAGVAVGAAVGQTVAAPAAGATYYAVGTTLYFSAGVALGPAVIGALAVGGVVWLGATALGGVVGAKAGEQAYRAVCPEDAVKDACEFFEVPWNSLSDLGKDELFQAYQIKMESILLQSKQPKEQKQLIFQCNRHLAWLLDGIYPGTLDVLGINKGCLSSPVNFGTETPDAKSQTSKVVQPQGLDAPQQKKKGYKFVDATKGIIARGKEKRGGSGTNYKFGDFTRGMIG